MIRPLAVLLVLAVAVLGLVVLRSPGSPGPQVRAISASPPDRPAADDLSRPRAPAADRVRDGAVADRGVVRRPGAPAPEGRDFTVTLDEMSPVVPRRGALRISGTVTNVSQETWTQLNIHPLTSFFPMTSARELEVSAASDPELYIGPRITEPGAFDDSIVSLAPGESARYSVRIPRDVLQISEEEGVYWIGVHVLGADGDGLRDGNAHGRARSFIPLVDRDAPAVPTSLVLPVRRQVAHTPEGRIEDVRGWARDLEPGGRLANLLDFGRDARQAPLTWLIDPAVLEAVQQIAEGNPPTDLTPTEPDQGEGSDEDGDDPDAAETTEPEPEPEPDPEAEAARGDATQWLETIDRLTDTDRVLGLPYGDLDVVAAAEDAPGLYRRARGLATTAFDDFGMASVPSVVPPSGLLTDQALALLPDDTEVLLSEEALPDGLREGEAPPATIRVGGGRASVYDTAAGTGGPGPDDRLARVALRQRMLAEAAVRSLADSEDPLQVVLPAQFDPRTGDRSFFTGLDQSFVDLESAGVEDTGPAPAVPEVNYPTRQLNRELSANQLTTATELVGLGETLDGILPATETVATQVLARALCAASYQTRDDPLAATESMQAGAEWVRGRLGAVTFDAPSFVILSSDTGPFAMTVTNDLDEPVEVRIQADTDDSLVIRAPETVTLDPETQQTVQLEVEARSIGVHQVRLVATGADGTPLGAVDEVSVRANSVGKVIWVVLGAGVAMLFLAIPVRWYRRWRRSRPA